MPSVLAFTAMIPSERSQADKRIFELTSKLSAVSAVDLEMLPFEELASLALNSG